MPSSDALPTARATPFAWRRGLALRTGLASTTALLLAASAWVIGYEPYTAGDSIGYNLGLVGGVLMLLLLPYSLRKRLRILRNSGTMRVWFLFHIWAGLLGPLLVVFHSTFRIGSFNGGVALFCTLLVTASGTVGRFFYRRVHRGMSGSRATLAEMQAELARETAALPQLAERCPQGSAAVRAYLDLATAPPAGRWRRAAHFTALGWRRRRVERQLHRTLGDAGETFSSLSEILAAAQRAAQFATYERLLARWHVIHIPFLYLLVLTTVVHVIAVHAY